MTQLSNFQVLESKYGECEEEPVGVKNRVNASFMLCVMRCCETVQTKDSAGRASYQKSTVGKGFAEHMSWICGAMLLP